MNTLADWVIVRFEQVAPMTLKLYFADKTEHTIDFEPVLRGAWLRPLREPAYFRQARSNEAGNLEWPDGQDFNPEALHDWQKFEPLYLEDGKQIEAAERQAAKDATKIAGKGKKVRVCKHASKRKLQPVE